MKKACGMQEADNGKTTEEGRMGKKKNEKVQNGRKEESEK